MIPAPLIFLFSYRSSLIHRQSWTPWPRSPSTWASVATAASYAPTPARVEETFRSAVAARSITPWSSQQIFEIDLSRAHNRVWACHEAVPARWHWRWRR
jgi:hypothetical protein